MAKQKDDLKTLFLTHKEQPEERRENARKGVRLLRQGRKKKVLQRDIRRDACR